jgi:cold shock CspA family protein
MPKASEQRQSGRIVSFSWDKGFGWISGPPGKDVFLGAASLRHSGIESVERGDWLEYTVLKKPDGRQEAIDIMPTVPTSAADRRAELLSKRAPAGE